MRYAIFTDIHANLEALEAVLAKIDELAKQTPIDQLWFLGDLVGYGPNPNECIDLLLTRTDVILAGNHDWAAIGKLDLDDFSPIARLSAEWTTKQLTEDHSTFLENLPERIVRDDCTLVHGSPYGPLWEYLTSEALAERSFQYFDTRYCFVGHTHVPIIFQQPDTLSNTPTVPLTPAESNGDELNEDEETQKMVAVRPVAQSVQDATTSENLVSAVLAHEPSELPHPEHNGVSHAGVQEQDTSLFLNAKAHSNGDTAVVQDVLRNDTPDTTEQEVAISHDDSSAQQDSEHETHATPVEEPVTEAVSHLDDEVEELLALLGLSQSLVQVTNEMLVPPLGNWNTPQGYRAIVNPGGVGQPRDGNPQAAFMIYDTEQGFTFYRVPYDYEKTQKKIIEAGLPSYLAARLAYGR